MKTLVEIDKRGMSREEWLDHRKNGIGGSEVGAIMGYDKYKSRLVLWAQKTGQMIKSDEENWKMFMGNRMEDFVAEMWQYFNPAASSVIKEPGKPLEYDNVNESIQRNYNADSIVRKARRKNFIVKNPEFPHLFANLDYQIVDQRDGMGPGILECKTIGKWAMDQWATGIPVNYIVQVYTYMIITGYKWAEIAVMVDENFDFHIYRFHLDDMENLPGRIISETAEFWDSVVRSREILSELETEPNQHKREALRMELDSIEPVADSGAIEWLNDRYEADPNEIVEATPDLAAKAVEFSRMKDQLSEMEAKAKELEAHIKQFMGEATVMNVGEFGTISWKADKNGKRTMRRNIKL